MFHSTDGQVTTPGAIDSELQGQPPGLAEHDFSSFLRGVVTAVNGHPSDFGPINEHDFDPTQALHGLLDFTVEGDFGFEDVAMGLSNLPTSPSHYFAAVQPLSSALDASAVKSTSQHRHIALGIEAYKQSSLGVWEPSTHDQGGSGIESLSALGPSPPESFNVPPFEPDPSLADKKVPVTARDEILSMVLSSCRPDKKRLVTKAFPAPALLDTLIQAFFAYHRYEADSFIHEASFSVSQQRPELLASVISAGATMTDSKLLHTVGFAMEETLRCSLRQVCEEENAATRKLWVLQAITCQIEVGIWSGMKRKIELSESHRQHPYTMLRRAGRFNAPSHCPPPPLPEDTGSVLHQKWLAWVEHESFTRIAYRAFITDTQASIALSTNPLISFAEMKTPMPASRRLWLARSAEEWKTVYLTLSQGPSAVSLVEYMNKQVEPNDWYDEHFCQLIILCGIWGMFWHYHQLRVALSQCRDTNAGLSLQHQQISQALNHFRINCPDEEELPSRGETMLLLELLYMHLHMPFQEVELFAGKGTQDDARRALPVLRGWLDNEESRRAIWHAGQVLRAAAKFTPMHLRGFFAIGVYQAALTIWVYSIAPEIKGAEPCTFPTAHGPSPPISVCLNGPDMPAVQRFISRGKPDLCVIQPSGTHAELMPPIPLSDQESVVNMVQETLNNNFHGCDALPPLVENLNLLLHNLGRAATSIKT
ncbi:hypothetical protein jhhlp_004848 [Lomentospora prolificans]|uniref:Xylanolytic transcriptional activator regulatory domain-containing protein n=1 Tax=Lomentospora prolificans TaxID=41688 RepID=A0A2N3N7Q8_9PEZI|nr:hypothetical protein jhhlp_004848 [Lomentospora prolificans]